MHEPIKPGHDRVKCISPDCSSEILPATAKVNEGLCGPCHQKKKRKERENYVQENRKDVDLYASIDDPVRVIEIFYTTRPHDPLIRYLPPRRPVQDLFRTLSEADAARLMEIAVAATGLGDRHLADSIAKSLAVLTGYSLEVMLERWAATNGFRPALIFRGAGPQIRDVIIESLESGRTRANDALLALAFIGDEVVQKRFRRWDTETPKWRTGLHIAPSKYSDTAGWELTKTGRRNLFHSQCYAITPEPTAVAEPPVQVMKEAQGECPWCHRKLVHLIELDLKDERFAFLGLHTGTLPILTCDACTCFGVVYAKIDSHGGATWAKENQRPAYLPDDAQDWEPSRWRGTFVSLRPRRAIEAFDWCMGIENSQIGGMPSWVQDSEYPACPSCQRTMTFVAQVDNEAFPSSEGIFYAFLCAGCWMSATTFQQT